MEKLDKQKLEKRSVLLWCLFVLYSALTLVCSLRHEMWLDEAQAWVILRDSSLAELPKILQIEGHPPLWYALLYPFVKLGFPVEYASVISWVFGALGAFLLLFKVKMPLFLKIAVLFSAGSLFFNSVILRVYCLIPPIMYGILLVYPSRRRHPMLYGLLIALLANTHIMMSGLVGALGIFMLIDLFKEWKGSSKKENIGKLAGLAIAGAGVLLLVIPLLGSLWVNGSVNDNLVLDSFSNMFSRTLDGVFSSLFLAEAVGEWLNIFVVALCTLAFWMVYILLFRNTRAFVCTTLFFIIYCVCCGALWSSNHSRSSLLVLVLVFCLCLADIENAPRKKWAVTDKTSGFVNRILSFFNGTDGKPCKALPYVLAAFFIGSVPVGVYTFCTDVTGNFANAKAAARFCETLEEDAVFVNLDVGLPEVSVYSPSLKIYSIGSDSFSNYSHWEYGGGNLVPEFSNVEQRLEGYRHIYVIGYEGLVEKAEFEDPIFDEPGNTVIDQKNHILVYKYDSESVRLWCEIMKEAYELRDKMRK